MGDDVCRVPLMIDSWWLLLYSEWAASWTHSGWELADELVCVGVMDIYNVRCLNTCVFAPTHTVTILYIVCKLCRRKHFKTLSERVPGSIWYYVFKQNLFVEWY